MKYGCSYRVIELNDNAMTKIQRTLDSEDLVWRDSLTHNSDVAQSSQMKYLSKHGLENIDSVRFSWT